MTGTLIAFGVIVLAVGVHAIHEVLRNSRRKP